MDLIESQLRKARALARALDTAVGVPGTSIRFGLDAILGLVPGAGDLVTGALSGYIVLIAVRGGLPRPVIWRMLANIGVDTLLGSVPVLGDVFDVAYKSNIKNVELLERYAVQPAAMEKRSRWLGILIVVILALLLAALAVLSFLIARLVWRLLTG